MKVKSFLKHLMIKTFCNHRKDATKQILSNPVYSKRLNQSFYNIEQGNRKIYEKEKNREWTRRTK